MKLVKKITLLAACTTFCLAGSLQAKTLAPEIINSDSIKWTEAQKLPPGAQVAILYGDPSKKEPFVARVKLPANYSIPVHSHPINETETILSGTLYLGMGDKADLNQGQALTAGSFFMIPAKVNHYTWTTKEETIVQISGVGPWGMMYKKES